MTPGAPVSANDTAGEERAPARPLEHATGLLRIYARAFLSQGVGLVGLAWCLAQDLPLVAGGLTVLVLADQAIFLRGRQALTGLEGLQRSLDVWCIAVSGIDLLLLFAAVFRSTGLHEIGGMVVSDPLSCFAFALAAFARLDIGLVPSGGLGRLTAALEALLRDAALIGLVAVVLARLRRRG